MLVDFWGAPTCFLPVGGAMKQLTSCFLHFINFFPGKLGTEVCAKSGFGARSGRQIWPESGGGTIISRSNTNTISSSLLRKTGSVLSRSFLLGTDLTKTRAELNHLDKVLPPNV